MGQIEKTVSFSDRGMLKNLTENNGTITNVQLHMVIEKFNCFENFKNLLMGGHDEKLKNFDQIEIKKFWQIEKKIIDLYELDNSKQKIFFEKKISK